MVTKSFLELSSFGRLIFEPVFWRTRIAERLDSLLKFRPFKQTYL
uniref:Uncharacterized protein n=1 Tax=Arundo donax TaxID=35708 RepID=A0A0A9CNE6_ARUDO